jgi:hypothetical protein
MIAKITKRPSMAAWVTFAIILDRENQKASIHGRTIHKSIAKSTNKKWALGPFHSPPLYRIQTPATRILRWCYLCSHPCSRRSKTVHPWPVCTCAFVLNAKIKKRPSMAGLSNEAKKGLTWRPLKNW